MATPQLLIQSNPPIIYHKISYNSTGVIFYRKNADKDYSTSQEKALSYTMWHISSDILQDKFAKVWQSDPFHLWRKNLTIFFYHISNPLLLPRECNIRLFRKGYINRFNSGAILPQSFFHLSYWGDIDPLIFIGKAQKRSLYETDILLPGEDKAKTFIDYRFFYFRGKETRRFRRLNSSLLQGNVQSFPREKM